MLSRTRAPCGQAARISSRAADGLARVSDEPREQPELGRRQGHRGPSPNAAWATGSSRSAADSTARSVAGAPQERRRPGHELGERERLREVVVAAGVEAGEPVGERVARGQEQHGRPDPLRAHGLADVAAVGVRQADVEDEQIGQPPCPAARAARRR